MTALGLGALVLSGCGSSGSGAPAGGAQGMESSPSADVALDDPVNTDVQGASKVELLSPGSGDLEVRRFVASSRELPKATIGFDESSSVEADGKTQEQDGALPARTAEVTQSVQPDVDGAQRAEFTFSSLAPDAKETGLDELLGSAKGFDVTFLRSADGSISASTLQAPTEARGVARQSVEQMAGALAESAVILPSDPIGVGAKWKVTRPVNDAVAPEMTVTYTLTAIDGDALTISVDGDAPATTDTLELPAGDGQGGAQGTDQGTNQGDGSVSMHVDDYSSTVKGELTLSLDSSLPTSGKLENDTTARYLGDNRAVTTTKATRTLEFGAP